MPRIRAEDASAWAEKTKLPILQLESELVGQMETRVLARLSAAYPDDVITWVSPDTTPQIVRTVISMLYVAWFYDRQYSEEQQSLNDYAVLLRAEAETLLQGILDGSIIIPGVVTPSLDSAAFYPTDTSSALCPTSMDSSLGDAKFSMGKVY